MSLGDVLNSVNELAREAILIQFDTTADFAASDLRLFENGVWVRWRAENYLDGDFTLSFTEGDTNVFAASTPVPASRLRIQQIATSSGSDPLTIGAATTEHTVFNGRKVNHIVAVAQGDTPKRFLFPVVVAANVGLLQGARIIVAVWGIPERSPLDFDALSLT